ncbi:MAG: anthranilate phosphoribosyltransferase, partial [Nitrospirota bacterium]
LVLGNLGAVYAMVVHGEDVLDEVSISAKTKVSRFRDGKIDTFKLEPEIFGLWRGKMEDLRGGNKDENAAITVSMLRGEKGPKRDTVLMNSAVACIVAGMTEDYKTAFEIAADSIDSGKAWKKLEVVRKVSNAL